MVTAELAIDVGLALLLDRNIRGMSVLRTLFILPMMIAPVVVGLMWHYMYHPTVGTVNKTLKSMGFESVDWLGQHALLSVMLAESGNGPRLFSFYHSGVTIPAPLRFRGSQDRWCLRIAADQIH